MSKAKLVAAKELIQEKHYEEARTILKTIDNDPTAIRWLKELDRISSPYGSAIMPPPPSQTYPQRTPITVEPEQFYRSDEAERFYRAENRSRRRRRIGGGIRAIMGGISLFVVAIYMASLPKFTIPGNPPPDDSLAIAIFAGGLLFVVLGFYLLIRAND